MATPENPLNIAVDKIKSLWTRWEPYAIGVAAFVLGFLLGKHWH